MPIAREDQEMRGPDERSDEELAELVRRGDDDAFAVL